MHDPETPIDEIDDAPTHRIVRRSTRETTADELVDKGRGVAERVRGALARVKSALTRS